jgi:hypothetical protein
MTTNGIGARNSGSLQVMAQSRIVFKPAADRILSTPARDRIQAAAVTNRVERAEPAERRLDIAA